MRAFIYLAVTSILKPEIRRDYTKLFYLLLHILSKDLGSGPRKSGFLRTVPVNPKVVLRGLSESKKEIGGVTTHFPEIIELKFGKKKRYIVQYFKAFLEL